QAPPRIADRPYYRTKPRLRQSHPPARSIKPLSSSAPLTAGRTLRVLRSRRSASSRHQGPDSLSAGLHSWRWPSSWPPSVRRLAGSARRHRRITPASPFPACCPTSKPKPLSPSCAPPSPSMPSTASPSAACSPTTVLAIVPATFASPCLQLGIQHRFTRPYTPRTNGKAERFIQTALREWAYVRHYLNSEERDQHLSPWLEHYNFHRPHASLGYAPPISRAIPPGTTS